jgi:hypothetical protein
MEIRLIGISLNHQPNGLCVRHLLFQKEKSRRRFFLLKVSLISILQNSTKKTRSCTFASAGSLGTSLASNLAFQRPASLIAVSPAAWHHRSARWIEPPRPAPTSQGVIDG